MNDLIQVPIPPATVWEGLRYCHDPLRVGYHFAQVRRAVRMLASLCNANRAAAWGAMQEIRGDRTFLAELYERYRVAIGHMPRGTDFMFLWHEAGSLFFHGIVQYALVRLLKPKIVLETGGTPGNSSAFMLRAMDRNGQGELHTVDLPPSGPFGKQSDGDWLHAGLPEGQGSGWVVPDRLRVRHHQHLGDARVLLPQVFAQVPQVDVFTHDSDHSYTHMLWEFHTAWPHVRPGGVLMSDDVGKNTAFAEFASAQRLPAYYTGGLGALSKPC